MLTLIFLGFLIFAGFLFYKYVFQKDPNVWVTNHQSIQDIQGIESAKGVKYVQSFECDGREHCSQMNSRAEAFFFIRNCPNTKMDGDGDGVPCERQFGH